MEINTHRVNNDKDFSQESKTPKKLFSLSDFDCRMRNQLRYNFLRILDGDPNLVYEGFMDLQHVSRHCVSVQRDGRHAGGGVRLAEGHVYLGPAGWSGLGTVSLHHISRLPLLFLFNTCRYIILFFFN